MRLHPHGWRSFLLVPGVAVRKGVWKGSVCSLLSQGVGALLPGFSKDRPREVITCHMGAALTLLCALKLSVTRMWYILAVAGMDRNNRSLREEEPWTHYGAQRETEAPAGDQTPTLELLPQHHAQVQLAVGVAACQTVCGAERASSLTRCLGIGPTAHAEQVLGVQPAHGTLPMLAPLQPHLIVSASFIRGTKVPLGCLDVW